VNRAAFVDRDGVLNKAVLMDGRPRPPADLAELELEAGAADAVAMLREAGFVVIGVTNQPDASRGTAPRRTIEAINAAVVELAGLDDLLTCFHDDGDHCACRKPAPGMLVEGATRHGIDLAASIMVGDRWSDVVAGHLAGCRAARVGDGYGEPISRAWASLATPDIEVASLLEAAEWATSRAGHPGSLSGHRASGSRRA